MRSKSSSINWNVKPDADLNKLTLEKLLLRFTTTTTKTVCLAGASWRERESVFDSVCIRASKNKLKSTTSSQSVPPRRCQGW